MDPIRIIIERFFQITRSVTIPQFIPSLSNTINKDYRVFPAWFESLHIGRDQTCVVLNREKANLYLLPDVSLFLILLLLLTPISAQEVEDEREFDYCEGSGKGPQHWGDLKEEWAACKNGVMQSPIDLSSQKVQFNPKLEKLEMSYKPSNATVKNRGHDIAVQWLGDAGTVQINGTSYVLQQCHWHSPAEHTVNGKRYDLELHMVHTSVDPGVKDNIAVVGLFYTTVDRKHNVYDRQKGRENHRDD